MRLYSIWCAERQKFYQGVQFRNTTYKYEHFWSGASPTFWKTIDGAIQQLRKIASTPIGRSYYFRKKPTPEGSFRINDTMYHGFDPARLSNIEVIIADVKVLGETRLPADAFIGNIEELAA